MVARISRSHREAIDLFSVACNNFTKGGHLALDMDFAGLHILRSTLTEIYFQYRPVVCYSSVFMGNNNPGRCLRRLDTNWWVMVVVAS